MIQSIPLLHYLTMILSTRKRHFHERPVDYSDFTLEFCWIWQRFLFSLPGSLDWISFDFSSRTSDRTSDYSHRRTGIRLCVDLWTIYFSFRSAKFKLRSIIHR
jgi:hypothetical protein